MAAKPISAAALPPGPCAALVDYSPLPIATVEGASHRVRYVNPAFCRLLKKPAGKLLGKTFLQLLPTMTACAATLDRVFLTGVPEEHTDPNQTLTEPLFWAYAVWPVFKGEPRAGVMIQVTETAPVHLARVAINEALLLSSLSQHELTESAERLNTQLRLEGTARQQSGDRLRLLWDSARVLLSTDNPATLMQGLFNKIGPALGVDAYFTYSLDEAGTGLQLISSAGMPRKRFREVQRLKLGESISGTVARNRLPIHATRLQQSREPMNQLARDCGFRAFACNPLLAGNQLLGTLAYASRTKEQFDSEELGILQTITHFVAIAYDSHRIAAALRTSETRYRRLFEAAHDGVLLLDPRTRKITDANPFMTQLLDYPYEQLVGKELFEIGLFKDETASQRMFRNLKKDHQVRYDDLPLESRSGRHQEVEVVANLYQEAGQSVIQCNIRDITDRKQAEDILRRNEALFSALIEQAPVGVYVVDVRFRLQQINAEAMPVFGKIQPLLGRDIGEVLELLWSKPVAAAYIKKFRHTLKTGHPYQSSIFNEVRVDSGQRQIFDWQIQRVTLPGGEFGVVAFFNDITERTQAEAIQHRLEVLAAANEAAQKEIFRREALEISLRESEQAQRKLLSESRQMHAQLRFLTRQVMIAQEDERKKISRDLHDDVLQTLVGINVNLSALELSPVLKANIRRTQRLVANAVKAVHSFARDLRPAVLDDFGLIAALQGYCTNLAARKKIKIHLQFQNEAESLGNAERTALFRVAQEALTNVTRHAHASKITVQLSEVPGFIRLEIGDNGKSFDVAKVMLAPNPKRLGLLGMRERVEMVGGTLKITSSAGQGTLVQIDIPFQPPAAAVPPPPIVAGTKKTGR